jgi:hypothetical protein
MQNFLSVAIVIAAIAVVFIVARASAKRGGPRDGKGVSKALSPRPSAAADAGPAGASNAARGELIAVIAAAVSAASGMAPGSFRITGMARSGPLAQGGFNTPVWGHVDRQ